MPAPCPTVNSSRARTGAPWRNSPPGPSGRTRCWCSERKMSAGKTVLVLGAGVGGIVAAMRLRRLLPPARRVGVVEGEVDHVYSPSLLWLMIGDRDAGVISRPLARLRRRGVELVHGMIEGLEAG